MWKHSGKESKMLTITRKPGQSILIKKDGEVIGKVLIPHKDGVRTRICVDLPPEYELERDDANKTIRDSGFEG